MSVRAKALPVIAVRPGEGRSGSTLLMQLLATSPEIVFDTRYPAEYRFLSYFARMAAQMTEPFDERRHIGVTPFFFGPGPGWGPVPFETEVVDVGRLGVPLLGSMWEAWTKEALAARPDARYYAEKIAVPIDAFVEAGIDLRVIDLVRDPRDVLASIRDFTSSGMDGFQRRSDQTEDEYADGFIARVRHHLVSMQQIPDGMARIVLRYEDLVRDLRGTADRIGSWLGVELDADAVLGQREAYRHHMTTASTEESIGRWKRDLAPPEAERIASALRPILKPLGYDI
jgi:hypothetical protein